MKNLVIELYIKVFEFLCHAMRWFSSWKKRFSTALRQTFLDEKVKQMGNGIQKTIQKIRDEASHVSQVRVLDLHNLYGKRDESSINNGQASAVDGYSRTINERSDERETHNLRLQIIANENREDDEKGLILKFNQLKITLGYASAGTLEAVEEHILYGESGL